MVILKTTMMIIGLFGITSASITETVVPSMEQCDRYLYVVQNEATGVVNWFDEHSMAATTKDRIYTYTVTRRCINVPE